MTLSSALASANSGLAVTSRRADVVAGNIANASTPGYVRRNLVVAETVLSGQGQGVHILGISRSQDLALSHTRRQAEGSAVRADIISRAYSDLNRELGTPGDGQGLFSAYQNAETALRELSVTPESPALQNAAYNSFSGLAAQFGDLNSIAQDQRLNADNAIARSVRDVNENLHRITELNQQISALGGQDGSAALEDERQRVLDQISLVIPIKIIPKDAGQIDIITEEGVFLLAGSVREINFTPASVIPPGTTYGDASGILSGITVDGQDLTFGGNSIFSVSSGVLAGYFTIRDKIAPEFTAQLDALAGDLISRFSQAGVDPTNAIGAPGIFTDNGAAFNPINIDGLAGRLQLNAAIDPVQGGIISRLRDGIGAATPGPSGNADVLNNLLSAFTDSDSAPAGSGLFGSHSSSELAAGLSSLVGEAKVHSDALTASSRARANTLSDAELAKTGVDTDAEMQTLLLVEQAYAANARVIKTISEMLDVLMAI